MNKNELNNHDLQKVNGGHETPTPFYSSHMHYYCPICGAWLCSASYIVGLEDIPPVYRECVCPTCGPVTAKGC